MTPPSRFRLRLALTASLLLAAGSGSAFTLLQPVRTFDGTPTFVVDDRGLEGVDDKDGGVARTVAAVSSTLAWNGVFEEPVLAAKAGSVAGFQVGDGIPMINFRDPFGVCSGNCVVATFIGFYSPRGDGSIRIDDADMVTNAKLAWSSEGEDPGGKGCKEELFVEGVMVHEVGHALGLGHSAVAGATMSPSVSACDNGPATLADDDRLGLLALYAVDCLASVGCEPGATCTHAGVSCCCCRGSACWENTCTAGTWGPAAKCASGLTCTDSGVNGACG